MADRRQPQGAQPWVATGREELECPIGLRVEKADGVGDRIYVEGNAAASLGAVYGGAYRLRLVSADALDLARRGFTQLFKAASHGCGDRQERSRSSSARTNWLRSAW